MVESHGVNSYLGYTAYMAITKCKIKVRVLNPVNGIAKLIESGNQADEEKLMPRFELKILIEGEYADVRMIADIIREKGKEALEKSK